jgi:hypothetical protein
VFFDAHVVRPFRWFWVVKRKQPIASAVPTTKKAQKNMTLDKKERVKTGSAMNWCAVSGLNPVLRPTRRPQLVQGRQTPLHHLVAL